MGTDTVNNKFEMNIERHMDQVLMVNYVDHIGRQFHQIDAADMKQERIEKLMVIDQVNNSMISRQ